MIIAIDHQLATSYRHVLQHVKHVYGGFELILGDTSFHPGGFPVKPARPNEFSIFTTKHPFDSEQLPDDKYALILSYYVL